jgi:hypothetical protein
MNDTRDTSGTATAGDGGGLDPQEAAALLEQAQRQARRQLEINPPALSLIRAAVVLGAYGAIWLSVRGSTPTKGRMPWPSSWCTRWWPPCSGRPS